MLTLFTDVDVWRKLIIRLHKMIMKL